MRTSHDVYKFLDGTFISIDQMTTPPEGSTLWNGYNYDLQEWWKDGKKDTRTLEELRADIKASLCTPAALPTCHT